MFTWRGHFNLLYVEPSRRFAIPHLTQPSTAEAADKKFELSELAKGGRVFKLPAASRSAGNQP
jgi:hypothetical protein